MNLSVNRRYISKIRHVVFTRIAFVEAVSTFLIVLYIYTGIAKLMKFSVFQEQLFESPVLSPFAEIVSYMLPLTEFVISSFLFVPRLRKIGLLSSLILMILFTAYVILILSIDEKLPCSCGGIIGKLSWPGHLIFNSCCILLNYLAIRFINRERRSV